MSERLEDLIAREGGGTLTPEEREMLERSLEGDALQREVLAGFRQIDAVLKAMPAPPSGWEGLWSKVQAGMRNARRLMVLLVGVGIAQVLAAVAAFSIWRDRFPLETALGLGISIAELPLFLVLAWYVGEKRTRLKESTGDWLRLSREWADQLERGARGLHLSACLSLVIAIMSLAGAIVAFLGAGARTALFWLELLTILICALGYVFARRDERRLRAERRVLREQLEV